MRISAVPSLLMVLLLACGSTSEDPPDGQLPDTATSDDPSPGEFAVCMPGTFQTCSDDQLGQVVCNVDGTAWEVTPCGTDSVCLSDNVGCTACIPGTKKCQDDDIVLRCDETGSEFVEGQNCNGVETGQICLLGSCVKLCEINQKLHSYIGCEYWGADLDNAFVPGGRSGFYDAAGSQYSIVVSNTSPKYPAKVQVFTNEGEQLTDSDGNPWPADPVPPMGLRIFNLPRRDVNSTVQAPLAYKVSSSIPITAYQFNPLENVDVFSNDASILLPSHVLGKYYIVMTREQTFQELKGYLTVIATYPGETQVTLTVTAPTLADNGIEHLEPGDSIVRVLNQFDVLNIETDAYGADLSGSVVLANHPVAVFGGSEASNAPNTNHCCPDGDCGDAPYEQPWLECKDDTTLDCLCEWPYQNLVPAQEVPCKTNKDCTSKYNTCCADHLEMQMYPVETWGKEYIATHSYPRGKEKDVWRIMAAENGTQLTTYPTQVNAPVLNRGEYVDFESLDHFEIHAKKPILVGQFLAAENAPDPNVGGIKGKDDANTGDPAFILAVSEEQFRMEYVFLSPDKYLFDCVNLIVPVGATVLLDGEEVNADDLTFRPIREIQDELEDKGLAQPSDLGIPFGDYSLVGTGKWGVYQLIVSDGVHTATSDQPFGVIAYGYDQYVSYGYPAGLNLEDLELVTEVP
ncbi:MAG: IgGFc-binding protein [Deltaproteobacteria bacterium]|nr:IgGFc-binding protein [Deltaproteobacteria bacterium]